MNRRSRSSPTLVSWLRRAAEDDSGLESGLRFVDRRERAELVPWSELHGRARRVAGSLDALGVRPGERVALIYPTGAEFFEAFFGVLLAGAVPVPLYPPVRLGRLDEYHRRTAAMLGSASARLLLASGRVMRLLGPTALAANLPLGALKLSQLPAGEGELERPASAEDYALVQFSSGTTVDPKPVALRHRHVSAQVEALNTFLTDTEELRHTGVSWLPLYHDMGLIGCVFPALERRSVMTLIGPEVFVARPAIWLRTLAAYEASISVAPNFAYGLCVSKIRDEELGSLDLSRWRVALNGAEAVSPGVLRAFARRFAPWGFHPGALTPVYGLSEATLAVTFSDLSQPFEARRFDRQSLVEGVAREVAGTDASAGRELISVGRPLPGTEIEILGRGDDRKPAGEGRIGRVMARGPSVMDGYLDRPEATARALQNGWLDTGDLGFVWRGELYLTGRAKDLLIVRGRNYQPEEVEQAVEGLPGLRAGCAVAVSSSLPETAQQEDPTAGEGDTERVLLFLERGQNAAPADLESLPEAARQAVLTASGLRLSEVRILEPGTLPRTSSGKLRRGETLRRHLAGELTPPKPVNALRLMGAMARGSVDHARARLRGGGEGEGDGGS
ncbi:MAG: fatty acyl-AMP ligase [Acidobacteriota bacterium]